jgi:hypothetical protein
VFAPRRQIAACPNDIRGLVALATSIVGADEPFSYDAGLISRVQHRRDDACGWATSRLCEHFRLVLTPWFRCVG